MIYWSDNNIGLLLTSLKSLCWGMDSLHGSVGDVLCAAAAVKCVRGSDMKNVTYSLMASGENLGDWEKILETGRKFFVQPDRQPGWGLQVARSTPEFSRALV